MAVELFKPFIIHKLVEKGIAETVKRAKKIVEKESPEVYEIWKKIIQDPPVLLNRAPSAASPGHPGVRAGAGGRQGDPDPSARVRGVQADFDGDQMAVHVPLSFESQTRRACS